MISTTAAGRANSSCAASVANASSSAGGDDCLAKPHSFAGLAARLQALLRRGGGERHIEVGGLRIDPATHTMIFGDCAVDLTPTEFRLLAELAAHRGEAVRRRALARTG